MSRSCIVSDSSGISNVTVATNDKSDQLSVNRQTLPDRCASHQSLSSPASSSVSSSCDLNNKQYSPTTIVVNNHTHDKRNYRKLPIDNVKANYIESNSEEDVFVHSPAMTPNISKNERDNYEDEINHFIPKVFVKLDSPLTRHNTAVSGEQKGSTTYPLLTRQNHAQKLQQQSPPAGFDRLNHAPRMMHQAQASPKSLQQNRSPRLSSQQSSASLSQLDEHNKNSNKWIDEPNNHHRASAQTDAFSISSDDASSETTNNTEDVASMKPSPSSSLSSNLISRFNQLSLPLARKLKFWNKKSFQINSYDPAFKVIYLGNLGIQLWSKEDSCVEKPLNTLWNNYLVNVKTEIWMRLTICNSGLKAITRQHGLTQYWSNRLIYCCSHKNFPKIFCWIYRHEGKKMRQELRCHAVLCPSSDKASKMVTQLNSRLSSALQEFRREKKSRQNSRMSISNSSSRQEISLTMPLRKQILTKGSANFRPPLERSKSAPKLTAIVEEDYADV